MNDAPEVLVPVFSFGTLFRKIQMVPEKYIAPQPGLRDSLQMLLSKDKHVFIVTNTNFDFLHLTMKATLGEDWINFFSMVIV